MSAVKNLTLIGSFILQINTLFRNRDPDITVREFSRFASVVSIVTLLMNIIPNGNNNIQNISKIIDLLLGLYSVKFYSEKKRYNDARIEILGIFLAILLHVYF